MQGINVMSSHHAPCQRSEEEARALLGVFMLQPPPDFAAQVLVRVQALHVVPDLPPARIVSVVKGAGEKGRAMQFSDTLH